VSRWRLEGGIPEHAADRVACALGRHPSNVWGRAWWDLATVDGHVGVGDLIGAAS